MEEILKLLLQNGGAIAMAIVLLWHFQKSDQKIKSIMDGVMDRIEEDKKEFLDHNRTLTADFKEATREQHAEIRTIMTDHISVTREVIKTVGELKGAIDQMKVELGRKADKAS